MSFLNKAKDLLAKHDDKVGQAVDKAAQLADSKTGGKYRDHIRTGSEKAKEAVEKLADDTRRGSEGSGADGKGATAEGRPEGGTSEGGQQKSG